MTSAFHPNACNKAFTCFAALIFILAHAPEADAQSHPGRGFWVASSAEVVVPADEAILVMQIQSSAPRADEAYQQNEATAQRVVNVLDELGLAGKYKLSADRFDSPSQPRAFAASFRLGSTQPQPIELTRYVFITFDGTDVGDLSFDQKLASTIASLTDAGAASVSWPLLGAPTQTATLVIFTLKDPDSALADATAEAIRRARVAGDQTAKRLSVRIKGVLDARINRPLEVALPRQQEMGILNELNLRYYSTRRDEVTIPASCAIEFSIK